MDNKETLVVIAEELGKALQPLTEALQSPESSRDFLEELGWDLDVAPNSFIALRGSAELALNLCSDNEEEGFDDVMQMITSLKSAFESIANLKNAGDLAANIKDELPGQLLQYLIVEYLLNNQPAFGNLLRAIGIISIEEIPAQAGRVAYRRRNFAFSDFTNLFNDPLIFFRNSFKWGQSDFRGLEWMEALSNLLVSWGYKKFIESLSENALNELTKNSINPDTDFYSALKIYFFRPDLNHEILNMGAGLYLLPETASDKPGFAIMPFLSGSLNEKISVTDELDLFIKTNIDLNGGVGILVRPDKDIEVFAGLDSSTPGSVSGSISFLFSLNGESDPFILIGKQDASRIEIGGISAEAGLRFYSQRLFEVFTEFGIQKGKIVIKAGDDADGFLAMLLPAEGFSVDFDLILGFSSVSGFYFGGSSGLEIQIPAHIKLGPIEITSAKIALKPQDGKFPVEFSSVIKAELGPLSIVVENIGLITNFSFPQNSNGNLGPVNLSLGFKPPNGLGLSINAGAVTGGGYLFFDTEKEEYAGVLELTIAGFISAKAIGLITTKMPDGSKGFSMLIIITAEFMPPFQLSYGFTLIGVGGLLGLNRTVLLDPLREGVRTGAVNSIMFPQNVIANAPRIISDLKTIFPPYDGKFLIGPMAKIGWGTPTLISLSLGLIIEIPGNIAILGVLKIALPEESIAVIKIQVLFVGTIDFDKKMITFDASMYESRLLVMTLEGDMAVRLKWGDSPDFILTAGGFHPSYIPPPLGLPSLKRMAINILDIEVARIRVECYQAVTSNTVQFGARSELYFGFSAISISGHIGFDALFQFSPFYFIIQASGSISLKIFGMGVFSITLRFSLEGPTPWRAKGRGSISFFFFDVSADFDMTWGESKNTSLPDIEIFPKFIEEISKREQWSTVLSSDKNLLVSLRSIAETSSALVLHPAGSLAVQQKLLPLSVQFDKIGNQKTSDVKKVSITGASSAGVSLTISSVDENFARAQYQNLSDAEKLSKPSFEKMPGGVTISMGANNINNGRMVRRNIEYEITIIDKEPKKPFKYGKFYIEPGILFGNFLRGNSVSKSVLSKNYKEKLQPYNDKMKMSEEGFAVAFSSNNKAFNETSKFSSEAMAQDFMNEQISINPSLKKEIHIIQNFELN